MPLGCDGLRRSGCVRGATWISGLLVHVEVLLHVDFNELPEFRIKPGHTLRDAIAGVIRRLIPLGIWIGFDFHDSLKLQTGATVVGMYLPILKDDLAIPYLDTRGGHRIFGMRKPGIAGLHRLVRQKNIGVRETPEIGRIKHMLEAIRKRVRRRDGLDAPDQVINAFQALRDVAGIEEIAELSLIHISEPTRL